MAKKPDLTEITGEKKDPNSVTYFAYKKSHSFSLPAFELDDEGNFKLDEKKNRLPLYDDVNTDKGTKRRVRKIFEFREMPNIVKKTEHGKTVEFKSLLTIKKSDPYFDDVVKYLNEEAKKGESPVWSAEEFNKNEHPEAYKVAEQMTKMSESYEKQISDLKEEIEQLKKGK